MNKKFIVGLAAVVLAVSAGFSYQASVFAKDNGKHGNDEAEQARGAHATGSTLEVHISDNGAVLVRGAKVTSVTSSSLAATTAWGPVSLNWTVIVDANTRFGKKDRGVSSLAGISVGDVVSFSGSLDSSASSLTVRADAIKDWSAQSVPKKHSTFDGTVLSANASSSTFVLGTEEQGNITVAVTSSTTIMKENSVGTFADITAGLKVTVKGMWNASTNQLEADSVKVHLAGAVRTTLEGRIKTLPGTVLPTTMTITVGQVDYKVNIDSDTSVLNSLWLRLPLGAMRIGDDIRVYGTVNVGATVDATVVRDTSLR